MAVSNTLAGPIAAAGSAPAGTAKEITERMAHAIADLMRERGANGTVTASDLHTKAFSPDQVAVYGPAAKARAVQIANIVGSE